MHTNDILFDEIPGNGGNIGMITLNRPQSLNALNHVMFKALSQHLQTWQGQPSIKAVIIRATEGRAFCAGGDVKSIYEMKIHKDSAIDHFFRDEYAVNRMIYHFPKPYIALLDGITMGGGAGVSIHGSHRVATERMTFAMPETTIGFFPDIGASYFLSRLAYNMGTYLGLSGSQIHYEDAHHLGLVDAVIPHDKQKGLIQELIESPLPNKSAVTSIIKKFSIEVAMTELMKHKHAIEKCFSFHTIEKILVALEQTSDWTKSLAHIISTKSPTSLKVTLQEMIRAEQMDFDACMDMEYVMMQHFLESHDFFEGVRSVLIDKDKNPKWRPSRLSEVSEETVSRFFQPHKIFS